MLRTIVTAGVALAWSAASAQGYFDFGQVPGLASEPKVQIDLNAAMLTFAREAARVAEPEAAAALEGVEGVRVRVYDIVDDARPVLDFIDDVSERLEDQGWQRMVYIQDEDARVRVYVTFNETRISGMTVMVAEEAGDEAVFINLLGEIDPAKIGQAAAALGVTDMIPRLEAR
jgi:hypothetical protein